MHSHLLRSLWGIQSCFSFVEVKKLGGGESQNNKIYSTVIWDLRRGIFIKVSKIFGPQSRYSSEKKPHFIIWLRSKSVFDLIELKVNSVVN